MNAPIALYVAQLRLSGLDPAEDFAEVLTLVKSPAPDWRAVVYTHSQCELAGRYEAK